MPDEPNLRVVIDTNIFISAAIGAGASTRLIRWWLGGDAPFEVIACPQLLDEISEVLGRPRIRKRIPENDALQYVAALRGLVTLTKDPAVHDDLLAWSEQLPPAISPVAFETLLNEHRA